MIKKFTQIRCFSLRFRCFSVGCRHHYYHLFNWSIRTYMLYHLWCLTRNHRLIFFRDRWLQVTFSSSKQPSSQNRWSPVTSSAYGGGGGGGLSWFSRQFGARARIQCASVSILLWASDFRHWVMFCIVVAAVFASLASAKVSRLKQQVALRCVYRAMVSTFWVCISRVLRL